MESFGVSGARAARGLAAVFAVVLAALVFAAGPASAKPRVDVKLTGASQASLAGGDEVAVEVSSHSGHKLKTRISTKALQGNAEKLIAERHSFSLKPGADKTITRPLTSRGSSLVQSCLETQIRAKAAVKRKGKWRGAGKDTDAMKRDPARCEGDSRSASTSPTRPSAIHHPGRRRECLFPYPNDYFTRRTRTDTGRRLNLSRCDPRERRRHPSTRPTSTAATASARARRSSPRPRPRHPGRLRPTGAGADHGRWARTSDRRAPIVLIDAAHRRAPADLGRARLERDQRRPTPTC